MRRFRIAAALAVAASVIAAMLPAGASAAEQCLFQNEKATDRNQTKLENSLLCLTNVYRLRSGVRALPRDTRLAGAARGHSNDMFNRNFFDHFTPEMAGPAERAMAAGYPGGAGENIAMNTVGTVLELFTQWQSSQGHNENLLRASYNAAGFGVRQGCCPSGPEGIIGTQKFGVAGANTDYTGLDLFASSDACARAKLIIFNGRERLKKKKGSARQRLKDRIKQARKRERRICKQP